ncbi:MAG: hypothetical protein MH252_21865 [Thermosynechococcaceae cyanobacterium MS004]|nr:hypothetical protein [Thermosynechococcaceae cyanobacterium MS004]
MSKHHSRKSSKRLYRQVAIAALASSGILQPLLPVLAAGTPADTAISNTATATYQDDNGTSFDATSNTVQIRVAPISGITARPTGIDDTNGGAVEQGDQLVYKFDVTNIGNTPADIYIPSAPITTGLDNAAVTYQIGSGSVLDLPSDGIIRGVAADSVIKVFVTATVKTTGIIAGDLITVTLGNTGTNDNTAATQNIPDAPDSANINEVRTVFTTPQTYTENKEASATQSVAFATKVTPQAFALIRKTVSSINPGATPAGNDDTINYNLNFSVLNSSPNGSFSPAALEGTSIRLDSTTQTKILVSDAIPTGTALQAAPTAPAGWQVVYSTDSVDTTIPIVSSSASALPAANWSTTAPTNLSTVKRVGFIATATSIAAGSTAVDFPVSVVTSGLPVNGGSVENIAQVFGKTAGDATNKVVVDESGDASPSNFEDNGNPGSNYDPATDTGKANAATQGIDTNSNNAGIGSKGEIIRVTITGTVGPAVDSIFNGPNGQPSAVGPTDANDDFTNASTRPPAGQSPSANIPGIQSASFNNTISNPSPVTLADVTVQPISPTQADSADNGAVNNAGQYGTDASIPVGTLVTITEVGPVTPKTATYIYALNAGVYSFTLQSGIPVNFGSLAPNAVVNYKTDVILPADSIKPLAAVSIPLIAFTDDSPTATPGYTNESTNNITIDRVYTGYMKLVKEARILSADKNTVIQDWTDAASGTPVGTLTAKAAPGQYIEYRIRYENISTPANGTGNVILNARNFRLIEDGVTAPNTWGEFTTHQQNTTFSQGTVSYFTGTTTKALIGTTDPTDGSDVSEYVNVVPNIAPGGQGSFQFRRVVK